MGLMLEMASLALVLYVTFLITLVSLLFASSTYGGQHLSEEDYVTYRELEQGLLSSSNNETVPNLYILSANFFPLQSLEPVCVPVQYHLKCGSQNNCVNCINCTDSDYVSDFLWTGYNVNEAIGSVLLAYALDGIELLGFNSWEKVCSFTDAVNLYLNLSVLTYSSQDVVQQSLVKVTSKLKQYAANQGKPNVGDTSNHGYAIQWSMDDQVKIFDTPNVILTVVFIFVNIFICLLSISMTTYSYDILFKNVKHKKNPGYPIFWGLVVFTVCWNSGPSWLVLLRYSDRVKFSLAVMIPLLFLVALCVKKKSNFPVPGMSPNGCMVHRSGYHFLWEFIVLTCCRCLIVHIVQTLALWSILVVLTFLIYYLSAIIVTFYLYPTVTLIKVVFLKGVAVCIILLFSLVFSLSKFEFKCTLKAAKNNFAAILSLLTVITFMPVLAYLALVVGGIIFAESNDGNTLGSILTLLPSLFLLFIAWVSRGRLFPEGITDVDPVKEIASDLEKGATHKNKHSKEKEEDGHVQVPLTQPSSTYGSTHDQGPAVDSSRHTAKEKSQTEDHQINASAGVEGEEYKALLQS